METFNFPFHVPITRYPDNSTRLQFGKSYVGASQPVDPPQRIFVLNFSTMRWYGLTDDTTNPTLNIYTLEKFYQRHQLYKKFIYPHQVYGNVNCRFNTPFETPMAEPGGSGWTKEFNIELIECP